MDEVEGIRVEFFDAMFGKVGGIPSVEAPVGGLDFM